jgi:glycosyltransferase involved in cell wall biosynthesis
MQDIIPNQWTDYKKNVKVFYADGNLSSVLGASNKMRDMDAIYINGIFSIKFNFVPLLVARLRGLPIVISPRGMVQSGALSIKPIRKKIYLAVLKSMGLVRTIRWHATDAQEEVDIVTVFGESPVVRAHNVPKRPLAEIKRRKKEPGMLRMIFLSLIAEKKNLHLALECIGTLKGQIQFDIYGPVKDARYWKKCEQLIARSRHDVRYLGPVKADQVQTTLSNYHVLILPTKGENFGHAIYESFSVGTPAIISANTPWGILQTQDAGFTVESEQINKWSALIQKFIDFGQIEFDQLSNGAHRLAVDYYKQNDFAGQYAELFGLTAFRVRDTKNTK